MSLARLTRPAQTWALALESAFVDPAHPTIAELNDRRFVHFISCALTEDGTELTLGDSETDSTITFCSIGNEVSLTQYNATGNIQWLCDAKPVQQGHGNARLARRSLLVYLPHGSPVLARPGFCCRSVHQDGQIPH